MQFLMTILYILLFIVLLSVLIIVHELGHLAAAKAFNVYCLEYSIGMGPLLFKKKRKNGETQFSIRAIPFGGYVSMYGEGVELPEGVVVDESRSLNKIKAWKRAIVLLAGVTMNAVLALVFFFVSNCIDNSLYVNCVNVQENSIASEAGIPNNTIFEFEAMTYHDDVANLDRGYYVIDKKATINGDDTVYYAATFNFEDLDSLDKRDLAQYLYIYPFVDSTYSDIDFAHLVDPASISYANIHLQSLVKEEGSKESVHGPLYDIKVSQSEGKYQSFGLLMYYGRKNTNFGEIISGTFTDFGECSILLFKTIGRLFTDASSWGQVGGIIAVGFETTSVLQNFGLGKFLFYWGFISVNLAIFNLLPFPGLDGWQLLVLIVESTTRKKIPEKVKNIVSLVGIALLFLLMAVIVVKDLATYVFHLGINLL